MTEKSSFSCGSTSRTIGTFYTEHRNSKKANKFCKNWQNWLQNRHTWHRSFELSLQRKEGDIFRSTSKINGLKMKIPLWKKNVLSRNCNDFPLLNQFMKKSKWEFEDVFTEYNLSSVYPFCWSLELT